MISSLVYGPLIDLYLQNLLIVLQHLFSLATVVYKASTCFIKRPMSSIGLSKAVDGMLVFKGIREPSRYLSTR